MRDLQNAFDMQTPPKNLGELNAARKRVLRQKLYLFAGYGFILVTIAVLIFLVFCALGFFALPNHQNHDVERNISEFSLLLLKLSAYMVVVVFVVKIIAGVALRSYTKIENRLELFDPIDNNTCQKVLELCNNHPEIQLYQHKINQTDRSRPILGEYLMFDDFIQRKWTKNLTWQYEIMKEQEAISFCEKLAQI